MMVPAKSESEPVPRRIYITKNVLGCAGCIHHVLGKHGVPHSEKCRCWIEAEMKVNPLTRMRLQEVEHRRVEFVKQHMISTTGTQGNVHMKRLELHNPHDVAMGEGCPP